MQGKIIKGIAGVYYVSDHNNVVYECKARGVFRYEKMKPLVGDNVRFSILDEENKQGNVEEILERTNELIRPKVANVDGALVIFALHKPEPNLNLLDRFLIMMEQKALHCVICFNKEDYVSLEEKEYYADIYKAAGYPVFFTSALHDTGIDELKNYIAGKTYAVAGPSGVGKSSLINCLQEGVTVETGEISHKNERGKHTTRHSEIIPIGKETFIMDTPGFSSLSVFEMEKEELRFYYPEFEAYEGCCRYQGCTHTHEPECKVKEALTDERIHPVRYKNYCTIYQELTNKRRY